MQTSLYPRIEDGSLVKAQVWINDELDVRPGIVLNGWFEAGSWWYIVMIEFLTYNTTRACVEGCDVWVWE